MLLRQDMRRRSGYTVVEMMLALAVVAIIAAVAAPSYSQYVLRSGIAAAKSDILAISADIERFAGTNNGRFPASLAELGLVRKDPWGREYRYLNIVTASNLGDVRKDRNLIPINSDFDLYSMGPDGRSVSPLTAAHSHDDIIRGRNGRFVGLATDF